MEFSSESPGFDQSVVAPFNETLSSNPEAFLKPSADLFSQSATALKYYLDFLASNVIERQQRQQPQKGGQKRKREDGSAIPASKRLQIREVHVKGFSVEQIWEQAQRVFNASLELNQRDIDALLQKSKSKVENDLHAPKPSRSGHDSSLQDGSDVDMSGDHEDELEENSLSESENEYENGEGSLNEDEILSRDEDEEQKETGNQKLGDSEKIEKRNGTASIPFARDRHGLNDGFFSIDEFNKQSRVFEEIDAKRARNDYINSDEEDIDWEADPFVDGGAESIVDGHNRGRDSDDDSDDENAELLDEGEAEDLDEDEEMDQDMDEQGDGSEDDRNLRYDQFFDPPASEHPKPKASKGQTRKLNPEDLDADIERAMANVHRDLFEDEDSEVDNDESADKTDKATDVNQSTHEKARAKITDEIRRLEAANVANKEWTLIGEAKAMDRPINSLIEEDLDFERLGKPVPVITAEVTDDIESLIKRRVVAKEFDDLIRRLPQGVGSYADAKAKFVLDETKPQQSLAELYEADHLQATDRNYVSKKDEKLQKERDEITQLWNTICSQLDTLSNLHFRPKQPSANIRVVANVDTIMMEDARPSGGDGLGTAGTLAPQEVYAPGENGIRGELMTKGGAAVSKEEMSREEKTRRRRREKQKTKKRAGRSLENENSATAQKQQLVSSLGKGGVKVIGKDGALTDIRGRKASTSETPKPQASLKL